MRINTKVLSDKYLYYTQVFTTKFLQQATYLFHSTFILQSFLQIFINTVKMANTKFNKNNSSNATSNKSPKKKLQRKRVV